MKRKKFKNISTNDLQQEVGLIKKESTKLKAEINSLKSEHDFLKQDFLYLKTDKQFDKENLFNNEQTNDSNSSLQEEKGKFV